MPTGYDFLRKKAKEIQTHLDTSPVLKTLFPASYFVIVNQQIDHMEATSTNGKINSMFLLLMDDSENNFKQAKLLEQYTGLIFSNPHVSNADRNHIIGQMSGMGSTDTMFEISILGNLLKQLPSDKIELFPRTVGKKDVEAKVFLVDRWVYLDVTALNDSAEDADAIDRMLNHNDYSNSGGWIDFDKDMMRYLGKLQYKGEQFIPSEPNVLVLSMAGTRLLFVDNAWNSSKIVAQIDNVGFIMQFDRKVLKKASDDYCDSTCALTEKEKEILIGLLSNEQYEPLVYGM